MRRNLSPASKGLRDPAGSPSWSPGGSLARRKCPPRGGLHRAHRHKANKTPVVVVTSDQIPVRKKVATFVAKKTSSTLRKKSFCSSNVDLKKPVCCSLQFALSWFSCLALARVVLANKKNGPICDLSHRLAPIVFYIRNLADLALVQKPGEERAEQSRAETISLLSLLVPAAGMPVWLFKARCFYLKNLLFKDL